MLSFYRFVSWYVSRESLNVRVDAPQSLRWLESTLESADDARWLTASAFTHGDYIGGGTVARANIRTLEREFGDMEGALWVRLLGSHGFVSIFFRASIRNARKGTKAHALWEMVCSTEDYSILDEDEWSALESEEEHDAWRQDGANDFRRALARKFPHKADLCDAVTDDDVLYTAWCELAEQFNGGERCLHEESPYFPFDRALKRATWADVRAALIQGFGEHRRPRLRAVDAHA